MKLKILALFFIFYISNLYSYETDIPLDILIFKGEDAIINATFPIKILPKEKTYNSALNININADKIIINKEKFTPPIIIDMDTTNLVVSIERKPYRGKFTIDIEDSKLVIINQINLEEYLYGVIKSEIPSDWNEEAIKAQIIAARTYAIYKKMQNINPRYQLEANTNFQMYGGFLHETRKTNQLVDLTKGIILTYKYEPIEAIYHSSCGGFTEDAKDIWGIDAPYLQAVYSGYCKNSPKYRWQKSITYKRITEMLYRKKKIKANITKVQVGKITPSRRVISIMLVDKNSIKYEIPCKDFRLWFGSKYIPSTLFTIENKDDRITFYGRGFGHGVGLCQLCAKEMAEQGFKYNDILLYFYRGVKLNKIY